MVNDDDGACQRLISAKVQQHSIVKVELDAVTENRFLTRIFLQDLYSAEDMSCLCKTLISPFFIACSVKFAIPVYFQSHIYSFDDRKNVNAPAALIYR